MQICVGDADATGMPQNEILEINDICNKILDMPDEKREDVTCSPPIQGRYLTVQKVGKGKSYDWRLAELDVYILKQNE